jgi:hypothetical protein
MDGKNDLERIAAVIRSQNPDVVLLQEVDKNCGRSNRVDQAAELGRLLEMHSAFGKAMDHDGGEYGQAILSRTEIEDAEVHRLPSQGEPRIAFSATVDSPMGRVTVASVHLDYQDEARQFAQAQVAAAALLKSPHPVVSMWSAHQQDDDARDQQLGQLRLDAGESALVFRVDDDALVLELPAADAALAAELAGGAPLGAAQASHPQADLVRLLSLLFRHGQVIDVMSGQGDGPVGGQVNDHHTPDGIPHSAQETSA